VPAAVPENDPHLTGDGTAKRSSSHGIQTPY